MTASEISALLRSQQFFNHKYILENSYIYNWECDLFTCTKTGYAYEVEIKISRSDFFRDFEKNKHQYLSHIHAKKGQFMVLKSGLSRGDLIGRVADNSLYYSSRYSFASRDYDNQKLLKQFQESNNPEDHWGEWMRNERFILLHERTKSLYAPASRIFIIKYDKVELSIPNRFYFACPDGLIHPEEVPAYAGLLYIKQDPNRVITKKKAPLLHKQSVQHLTKTLLDKFWFLSERQRVAIKYGKSYVEPEQRTEGGNEGAEA